MTTLRPAPRISFEFFPPQSLDASFKLFEAVQALAPMGPEFVSVTYGAGGTTRRLTHESVATLHRNYGLNVAAHLTCVDASKAETLEIAEGYHQAGVRQIVALRGDAPQGAARQPFWHGIMFGLTNPKAYPVAVATFTALLSSRAELLQWSMLPALIFLSFLGGILAYAILIGIVGARRVRTLYQRHELAITRICGVMFVGFAINALLHAVPGLLANKS